MPKVMHFELPAHDPERASKFYKSVLGWTTEKWNGPEDYWMVTTGSESEPGINGGIMRAPGPANGGVVNTVGVENLDDCVRKVLANGGQVVAPRMSVPGMGYMAYCKDTEGNTFGLMQPDPSAK